MNLYTRKSADFDKNTKPTVLKISAILVSLALIIYVLNYFQSSVRNSFYLIASPMNTFLAGAGNDLSALFMPVLSFNNVVMENDTLKAENQRLLSALLFAQEERKSYQLAEIAFQTAKQNSYDLEQAQVVGFDSQNNFVLINKGEIDGIGENMVVVSETNYLYGRISKVFKNFSQVLLISAQNSILDVRVKKEDEAQENVYGVVKGQGDFSLLLDLVPSDASLAQNDLVLSSALGGVFPSGILVGQVVGVEKNDLKPFQTARVKPFFQARDLDELFVITNYQIDQ